MPRVTSDLAALLLRAIAGLIFLPHGWSKIAGDGGAGAFASDIAAGYHIPVFLGYVAAYAEFAGALLLIVGLFTRLDAFLLAATMFVATFIVQLPDALAEAPAGGNRLFLALRGIELPLSLFAICIALMLMGGGAFALDRFVKLPKKKTAAEAAVLES